MMANGDQGFYEKFYPKGGWQYDLGNQQAFIRDRIVEPLGLTPPAKVIDVGCGTGDQVAVFSELGFDVVGLDLSEEGIAQAREQYPDLEFICDDASNLGDYYDRDTFDLLFLRGMSWYHYELNDWVRRATARLMRFVKPEGYIVLYIKTDFSGEPEPGDGVINNKLSAYVQLFNPLGAIALMTDRHGKPLHTVEDTEDATNIIIATQKVKDEHPEEAEQWNVLI